MRDEKKWPEPVCHYSSLILTLILDRALPSLEFTLNTYRLLSTPYLSRSFL
jgi:hypothetical protein